jgi:CheY-like chemotaxis protein
MERRPTILIVDDDLESLRNRTMMFSDSGMAVREAASVQEAEKLIGEQGSDLDLAILDINLADDPLDRSGVMLAELLRERLPNLPIVAYSAYYRADELAPELSQLFDEWAVKGSMSVRTLDDFVQRCSSLARDHHLKVE